MIRTVGLRALREQAFRRANPGPLAAAMHRALEIVWADAAEAFVRAATREVLVETGMSAATFFPLARAIKLLNTGSDAASFVEDRLSHRGQGHTASGRQRRRSYNSVPEFPDGHRQPGTQGPREGDRRGKRAYRLTTGTPARPVFTFSFTTVVFQFAFHEQPRGMQNGLNLGIAAFQQALAEAPQEIELALRGVIRSRAFIGRPEGAL